MTHHPYLDHGLSILHARLQPGRPHPEGAAVACRPFITISREACAGATTLGQHLLPLLDECLGEEDRSWMFLDKDLITHALTQNHLPEHLAEYLPEDRLPEIQGLIGEMVGLHPPLAELEQRICEAIHQFAQLGRVIFAGRAAHLVTRDLPGGFHLRLVASMGARIKRMQALQNCDAATAKARLLETDSARRRYVQTKFARDNNDPLAYDLVINTDHIAPATAAQLVLRAMQDRVTPPAAIAPTGKALARSA